MVVYTLRDPWHHPIPSNLNMSLLNTCVLGFPFPAHMAPLCRALTVAPLHCSFQNGTTGRKTPWAIFIRNLEVGSFYCIVKTAWFFCCSFESFTGWNYVTTCPQVLLPGIDFSFLFHPIPRCPIPLTYQLCEQLLRALDSEELLIRWKSPVPGLRLCSWCLGSLNPFK